MEIIEKIMLTDDQKQVTLTGLLLILLGVVILFACLQSCSPYGHIAKNANPTEKEKSLLAIACAREFPKIITIYNVDSLIKATQKDYTKQIDSLTDLAEKLDSVIHEQIPIIDTAYVTDSNCLSRYKSLYQAYEKRGVQLSISRNLSHSLKDQIQSLKNNYKPCDSLRIATQVKAECDSAKNYILLAQLRAKSDSTLIMVTKWKDAKETAKNRLWIILVLAGLIGLGIFLKIKKII